MKSIVMDTANRFLALGLYEDDKCIAKYQEFGNRRQSEEAISKLEMLLDKKEMKMLDFDEFIITIGPGSYTGVRVALTIAKTLAVTSGIKIKAVSSLKAFVTGGTGISIIDARSKKAYLAVYQDGEALIADTLVDIDEIESVIAKYPDLEVFGDMNLIDKENKEVDLVANIYACSKTENYVEDSAGLVPRYIKDVLV